MRATELEFLRWCYYNSEAFLGDHEQMKEAFTEESEKELPSAYVDDDFEDDDDVTPEVMFGEHYPDDDDDI